MSSRSHGAPRLIRILTGVALAVGVAFVSANAGAAAPRYEPCPAQSDVSSCDSDGDSIPDTVERVVSGTATGASGREDTDGDGVPDWTEVLACGTVRCASSTKDSVGDGIPDFARILTCGSATCYTDNADINGNGVPRWASVVICGTTECATGHEDYDGDGISDAVELAACVTPRSNLAETGRFLAIWLLVAIACGLVVTGAVLLRKRPLFAAATRSFGAS
ncbi:hypothetical protein [uncultured Leifsonia sp.]|uniref:hypothetical protein n=1 Tax=uncultured Leifsonia sp. TaxID=340359 RepID=UPI0025CF33C2|nr:hypothetical protein [uncultured Leifsonia sp.]